MNRDTKKTKKILPGRNKKKMLLYVGVSLLAGLTYMLFLFISDRVFQAPPIVSVTIAYTLAMLIYFIVSKFFVFERGQTNKTNKEAWQFAIVVTVNYFLTQLIVNGVHHHTQEVYSGSIIAGIVTINLSYFIFDRIIFK